MSSAPGWRAFRPRPRLRGRACASRSMRPRRKPVGAAAPISIRRSDKSSTTATISSCRATTRRWTTCVESAREHQLAGPDKRADFDFVDIRSGERWTIAPNEGPLPLVADVEPARRVPGTRPADYLEIFKLLFARPNQRIDDVLSCKGALWDLLMQPFFLAALNTDPEGASASLAGALIRETMRAAAVPIARASLIPHWRRRSSSPRWRSSPSTARPSRSAKGSGASCSTARASARSNSRSARSR